MFSSSPFLEKRDAVETAVQFLPGVEQGIGSLGGRASRRQETPRVDVENPADTVTDRFMGVTINDAINLSVEFIEQHFFKIIAIAGTVDQPDPKMVDYDYPAPGQGGRAGG